MICVTGFPLDERHGTRRQYTLCRDALKLVVTCLTWCDVGCPRRDGVRARPGDVELRCIKGGTLIHIHHECL